MRSFRPTQRTATALASLLLLITAPGLMAYEPWAYTAPTRREAATDADLEPLVEQATAIYSNALQAFSRNEMTEAQQLIQDAMKVAPGSPVLQALAGRIYNNTGLYGLALELWNHLLEEFPNQGTFLAERCGTLLLLDREEAATNDLQRAIRFAPANLTVRYYQALWDIRQHDTSSAAKVTASLTGRQVLDFGKRLIQERTLIERITHETGFSEYAKILLTLQENANPESALPTIVELLEQLKPVMEKTAWAEAVPILQQIRRAGAGYPGLYYDLALCSYLLNPVQERLNNLEAFVLSERGTAFARYFIYLCLYAKDFDRAQRVVDASLKDARDEEVVLIRAALAYGPNGSDAAWGVLNEIPPAFRPATASWFARDIPVVRAIRRDARYETWLKAER